MTVQHNFKVGDRVVMNEATFYLGDLYRKYFNPYRTIVEINDDLSHVILNHIEDTANTWYYKYLKLYEEPKKEIEEWKPGWIVRNNRSKAEHEVSTIGQYSYTMKNKNQHDWSLNRSIAHGELADGSPAYSVISRGEKLKEESLPCVKIVPPVNIPEKKEITSGYLFKGSQLYVYDNPDGVCLYKASNGLTMYMNKEELRKTAQAMNILASILEENESSSEA